LNPPPSLASDTVGSSVSARLPGVLVVDDDPMVLQLLRVALPRYGLDVWTAQSGAAAVALLPHYAGDIDIALIDVRMPDLDGPHTLQALREIDTTLPACFMTGYGGVYSPADLYGLGIAHLFSKPFDLCEVGTVLRASARERSFRA
jgi:two-component system OmpR family response regulator